MGTWRADAGRVGGALTTAIKERLGKGTAYVHETFGAYRTVEELWDGEL
ncbi:hypothetical protein I3760_09G197900 [Carya illinoinensis]|uniref:Uncharacterized protein n=1 Tax=Carya illinoinensis TaxID=32201 RepID=A0A8T1PNH3_CARIL|nr:hypothetical protein I3760_09G197900 [Carya illinoinensis]KAG6643273.1 hypothetical protein CIPAW_09G198600 [Carya illinoinensis]